MTREEEIKNEAKLKCHDIASEVDYKSSAAYDGFIMGAEWSDKTLIEKTCKWMKGLTYQEFPGGPLERLITDELIEDYLKTIEK